MKKFVEQSTKGSKCLDDGSSQIVQQIIEDSSKCGCTRDCHISHRKKYKYPEPFIPYLHMKVIHYHSQIRKNK